ncbi:MAG: GTP-binding protein [Eubacteriales bacterium]|nr:GTP-binding protein [Eubacteriales bacterium]
MSINIIMLTGFWGTGKTTLLSAMLDEYKDEKIGVIVNDFGQVCIDGTLIERDGITMRELPNGSIFCACIKDTFLNSLIAMSDKDINYLFIEASGLADPSSMSQILKVISPKTIREYNYVGSICVVDGETFLGYYDLLPALHQQVAYSGVIIVNKVDLIEEDLITKVLNTLTSINPQAAIYVTSYCRVDFREITERLSAPKIPGAESSNTVESRPKTFILSSNEQLPYFGFVNFIQDLSPNAYRIKGFADTTEGNVYVSSVKNHVSISPWDRPVKETKIIVISAVGIRMMSIITGGLKGELSGKLKI